MRKAPERLLHKAVAAYLNAVLPTTVWASTFPSGGGGKVRGAQLKAMGLKKGVPDWLLIHAGRAHWIELKAIKGRVSEDQEHTMIMLGHAGAVTTVCRSIDDVRDALEWWNIPTIESRRASVAKRAAA